MNVVHLLRIGPTTSRTIRGKIYEVKKYYKWRAVDEQGAWIQPCLIDNVLLRRPNRFLDIGEKDDCWEVVHQHYFDQQQRALLGKPPLVNQEGNHVPTNVDLMDEYQLGIIPPTELTQPNVRKSIMPKLTIKETTLINNKDVDTYKWTDFIQLIQHEQTQIQFLEGLNIKSKAVDKKIKQHNDNIEVLTSLMDGKEEVEDETA